MADRESGETVTMSRADTIRRIEVVGKRRDTTLGMLAGRMHSVQAKLRLTRIKRNYHGFGG